MSFQLYGIPFVFLLQFLYTSEQDMVARLVKDPPRSNFTSLQDLPLWQPQNYFTPLFNFNIVLVQSNNL